jgi:ADP-heptose:LPS heptosyltransferase
MAEAFAVVRNLDLMVSDDSGLMHMAWVSGVPTDGIFGASRSVWSRPCGDHSYCFGSEDLECGACMSDVCARGDLLCLQRVSAEMVMEQCRKMMKRRSPAMPG